MKHDVILIQSMDNMNQQKNYGEILLYPRQNNISSDKVYERNIQRYISDSQIKQEENEQKKESPEWSSKHFQWITQCFDNNGIVELGKMKDEIWREQVETKGTRSGRKQIEPYNVAKF